MGIVSGKNAVFGLLVAFFLAVSIGGVFTAEMMSSGASYNCPYMGAPTLCAMGPLQHLSEWQQTFATIVQKASTGAFLLLALFATLLVAVRPRLFEPAVATGRLYRSPPSVSRGEKISRWLSLFENSPSLV